MVFSSLTCWGESIEPPKFLETVCNPPPPKNKSSSQKVIEQRVKQICEQVEAKLCQAQNQNLSWSGQGMTKIENKLVLSCAKLSPA